MNKLICFDFDKTLIDIHTHSEISRDWIAPVTDENVLIVNGVIKKSDENNNYDINKVILKAQELLDNSSFKYNKNNIKKTFEELLAENNNIAITSFNKYPEMIKLFLDNLGVDEKYKDKINIICGFPANTENGKVEHIEKAKELSKVSNNTNVILLDDDKKNIQKAEQKGIAGLLVDEKFDWSIAKDVIKAKLLLIGTSEILSNSVDVSHSKPSFQLKAPPIKKNKNFTLTK